jgi:hypothetical protein
MFDKKNPFGKFIRIDETGENEEARYQSEEALLSRPFHELSLNELRIAKNLLTERIENTEGMNEMMGQLDSVDPMLRLPENTIQGFYDAIPVLMKKVEGYKADLEIIEGLIRQKSSSSARGIDA